MQLCIRGLTAAMDSDKNIKWWSLSVEKSQAVFFPKRRVRQEKEKAQSS